MAHLRGCSALLPHGLRAVHTGPAAAAAGATGAGEQAQPSPPQQQPVQNPLQAALDAAAGRRPVADGGPDSAGSSRAVSRRWERRTWVWYDEADEREERAKERQRHTYGSGGMAHLLDVPQSMKKMNRILRLVRGLPYDEAVAQCQLVPHKAAKYVLQALERAREDAVEGKGMAPDRLVVGTIFVTKGVYEKGVQPMGKGSAGRKVTRKCHLRVVLNEAAEGKALFAARVVPPLMGGWQPRLGALGAVGDGSRQRSRFAYRTEV